MKATKAYIASLGTTGVLLAASILMLAVVSAVVAFDRWPGANVTAPIRSVVLTDRPARIRVGAHAAPSASRTRTAAATTAGGQRVSVGTQHAVSRSVSGGPRTATPARPAPAAPVPAVTHAVQPVQDAAAPIIDTISNPGSTTSQVADGAQAVANTVGGSADQVSPDAGSAVTGVGGTVADTVRSLPTPAHVLPGH
jgi:hypothetical protein